MKRVCNTLLLILIFLAALNARAGEFTLIVTADIHGRMKELSRFNELFQSYPDAVKADLGDLVQGTVISDVSDGEAAIEMLNLAKYQLWVPGNHEFELGEPVLSTLCRRFKGKVLGAQWQGKNFSPPAWTIVQRGVFRCGIIGLTETTVSERAKLLPGFRFKPTLQALDDAIEQLQKLRCHAIVLLWHNGIVSKCGRLSDILYERPMIDAVILAHTHDEIPPKTIGKTMVIQPGHHGRSAAKVTLHYHKKSGKKRFVTAALVRPGKSGLPGSRQLLQKFNRKYRKFLNSPAGYVANAADFAATSAGKIRKLCQSDAAVFDYYANMRCGSYDRFRQFAAFPFRNRLCVVQVTFEELAKFTAERVPAKRKRLICFPDRKNHRGKKLSLALADFQLYSSPALKHLIPQAKLTPFIERDIIFDNSLPPKGNGHE